MAGKGTMTTRWTRKDLLGLRELSADEINFILDTTDAFKQVGTREIKKVPSLRGKTLVNFFIEPSTRTRTSFELAALRLSADVINISVTTSSLTKGETLKDTARNLQALHADILVLRHSSAGAPQFLANRLQASVINAGDGAHEHPTQALLDLYTIRERRGKIAGLRVAIVGDILFSRVARSNIFGLLKLGAHVTLIGPSTLVPKEFEKLGVEVSYKIEDVLPKADVVNLLRIQHERQRREYFPGILARSTAASRSTARSPTDCTASFSIKSPTVWQCAWLFFTSVEGSRDEPHNHSKRSNYRSRKQAR